MSAPVRADQVTLNNGDHLTGKIAKADNSTLRLKADFDWHGSNHVE
jgi:hypothetical protein